MRLPVIISLIAIKLSGLAMLGGQLSQLPIKFLRNSIKEYTRNNAWGEKFMGSNARLQVGKYMGNKLKIEWGDIHGKIHEIA